MFQSHSMNDLSHIAAIARHPTQEEQHRFQSAGEFVQRLAADIQIWLHAMAKNGADTGKRWVLRATLANGAMVDVHRLSASGHSMIKLEGVLVDGTPCLLVAHHHSVQLLAFHIARKPEETTKREIGFHTGIGKEITITQ